MHHTARSILSAVCFVFMIMSIMNWINWADTPDWVMDFAGGFAVASLIAFIGAPPKRTGRPAAQRVSPDRVTVTKRDER